MEDQAVYKVVTANPAVDEALAIIAKEQLSFETQNLLKQKLVPFLEQASEWKTKAFELVVTSEEQEAEMKMAREGRLTLMRIRTTADKVRKELKAESNRYNNAVQGVYNLIEKTVKPIEEHLELQERFKEIKEAERKQQLREDRWREIEPYASYVPSGIDYGEITEQDYEKMLNAGKAAKKAADDEAEAARIREEQERQEQERLKNLQRERIAAAQKLSAFITGFDAIDWVSLTTEQFDAIISDATSKRDAHEAEQERLRQEKAEADRIKNLNHERLQALAGFMPYGPEVNAENLHAYSQEEFDALLIQKQSAFDEHRRQVIQQAKEKEEAEKRAKEEARKAAEAQAELDRIKAEQERQEKERLAAIEAELGKGDEQRFADLLAELGAIKEKYSFQSEQYKAIFASVQTLIDKTISYAKSKQNPA